MRSRIPVIIVIAALTALLILIVIGIIARIRQINALLPSVIANELQARLGRDVSFGSVRVVGPRTVAISDLRISERPGFGAGEFFYARRVVITYSAVGAILRVVPTVQSITSVTIIDPRLHIIRNRHGVLNISDLFRRPPVPVPPAFQGLVSIRSGTLVFTDYQAGVAQLPAVNRLEQIVGTLDFGPGNVVAVNIQGSGARGRIDGFRVAGRWGVTEPVTDLRVTVRDASAPYWLNYFTDLASWGFGAGTFSGQAVITQPQLNGPLAVQGSGTLRNAAVTSQYLVTPVRSLDARISFVGTNITLNGAGELAGYPVLVSGRINGFSPAVLDLRVSSPRIAFPVLQRAIRPLPPLPVTWQAPGSFEARITGVGSNPVVTGVLRAPAASVADVSVRDFTLRGTYRNGVIRFTQGTGRAAGGTVNLTATMSFGPLRVTGSGTASNINLALVPLPPELPATGRADARFTFTYRPGQPTARVVLDIRSAVAGGVAIERGQAVIAVTGPGAVTAELRIQRGAIAEALPVEGAQAQIRLERGVVTISQATATAAGGRIALEGTIGPSGRLNLRVSANDVRVGTLLGPLGYEDVTGTADFTGTITGTTGNPILSGRIVARNGSFRGVDYQSLAGRLTASRQQVVLSNVTLVAPAGDITATGSITIPRQGPMVFDVRLTAQRVDLARLESLLGITTPLSGTASVNLTIRGPATSPRISGSASLVDANIGGLDISSATVRLETAAGQTFIRELTARLDGTLVVGSGTISPQGALNLDIRAEDLDLSTFGEITGPYATLSGPAVLAGTVTGTFARPVLRADLVSRAPIVNDRQYDALTASVTARRSGIALDNASLVRGETQYRISTLRFVPDRGLAEVIASVSNVPVSGLLELIRESPVYESPEGEGLRSFVNSVPQPAEGILNADINLARAPVEDEQLFTGSVTLTGSALSFGGTPYGELAASLILIRNMVRVQQLSLVGPLGAITAQGSIGDQGEIALTGAADDLSLELLDPWLAEENLAGTVDATFTVGGTLENPRVAASVQGTGITVGDTSLGDISVAQLSLNEGRLSFDRLVWTEDGAVFTASGFVPISLAPIEIPTDQPLDISIQASEPDLSTAPYLPDAVEEARGSLALDARITGTLDDPNASGSLRLSNGFLNLRNFDNNFMDLNIDAQLQGSQLVVNTLTGESSLGGSFTGGGTVNIGGPEGGTANLFLNLNALRLSTTNLSGSAGESATFTATGRLEVVDTLQSPITQGTIVISDADIDIPARPVTTAPSVPPLPIPTELGITINLARNVTITRGDLRADIRGPITITGTSSDPVVSGTVQIVNGRITLPGRTLEFVPGGTATLLLQPPQPAVLSVDVTAQTTVTTSSSFTGRITRYRVFLDFTGPLGDLNINVRSSPPGIGELEALAAIFGGSALQALVLGEEAQQVFQEQLGQLLLGFALPGLFQPVDIGGITFGIEPGLFTPLLFTASTFISDRVLLSYTRNLIGDTPTELLSISYTLSPQLAVTVQFEEQDGSVEDTTYLIEYYNRF